uniref:Orexin receptor type 2 n=1 Tax=Cacopsylla melanoneura TaxID=428564 RepID=A0A8D9E678_9HEMI
MSCKLMIFFKNVPVAASTISVMMMSLDRYLYLQHKNRRDFYMIPIIWISTLLIHIPQIVMTSSTSSNWTIENTLWTECDEAWPNEVWEAGYTCLHATLVFIIPCLTVIICHHAVGHQLYVTSLKAAAASGEIPLPMPILPSRPKEMIVIASIHPPKLIHIRPQIKTTILRIEEEKEKEDEDDNEEESKTMKRKIRSDLKYLNKQTAKFKQNRKRKKKDKAKKISPNKKRLANMLFILGVVFMVCWLPYVLTKLYIQINSLVRDQQTSYFIDQLAGLFWLLGLAHSAINPIIYCLLNKRSLPINKTNKYRPNIFARHKHTPNKHFHPPSSTNEAALGIFHPKYTKMPPKNGNNNIVQRRESSFFLP